jgi:hypothetical protein
MKGHIQNTDVPGDYVTYEIKHDYQDQSKMLPYLYVFPIYACLSGEHMCVLECIYTAVHFEEYKKRKRYNIKIKEISSRII